MKNKTVSLQPVVSKFASYWRYCKGRDMHIVRDTSHNFCQKDSYVWTGLRKYEIDNSNNGHDRCYVIEIHQNTINYKMRNCTENKFFLCKNEIGNNTSVSSAGNIKVTKNTEPLQLTTETSKPTTTFSVTSLITIFNGAQTPTIATYTPESSESDGYITATVHTSTFSVTSLIASVSDVTNPTIATFISTSPITKKYTATVVGTSIAGVITLIFVVFIIICMLKRRKFQSMQSKQHQSKKANEFNKTQIKHDVNHVNTTFENDNQGSNVQIDGIYVEKEEEYDHLHTSRQKKATTQTDDDRYRTASYLEEDSYFTLRQNKNDEPDLDNGYSVNYMLHSKNQLGSVNSPEYDYDFQSNQRKDWL